MTNHGCMTSPCPSCAGNTEPVAASVVEHVCLTDDDCIAGPDHTGDHRYPSWWNDDPEPPAALLDLVERKRAEREAARAHPATMIGRR